MLTHLLSSAFSLYQCEPLDWQSTSFSSNLQIAQPCKDMKTCKFSLWKCSLLFAGDCNECIGNQTSKDQFAFISVREGSFNLEVGWGWREGKCLACEFITGLHLHAPFF